jgi:hypothetical protein
MKSILVAILLTGLLTVTALGQTTSSTQGGLSGIVTDPGGAVVAGATITLQHNATGAQRSVTTGSQGEFVFALVDPGGYTVTVEAKNFKKTVAPNITIAIARQSDISITLEIGAVSETVTVTAAQEMINSSSPMLSSTVNPRQIADLPMGDRNPLGLAGFQPGIAVTGNNVRGASVGGLRQTSTNVKQDGINAMDNFVKTSSFFGISTPSLNATDEFTISTGTNSSDAGFGVTQVNVRTSSGTNDLHGTAFELLRNDVLEANNFFNNLNGTPRPRERQNYFGFSLGGPVVVPRFGEGGKELWNLRNKAFWFFSYEAFREPFQATINRTVLTAPARSGIFTYDDTGGVRRTVDLKTIGLFHTLNPVTQAQINAMPLPNNTLRGDSLNTAGFRYNVSGSDPNDQIVWRYDHQLVEKSKLGSHKLEFVFNRGVFTLFPDTFNDIIAPFPGLGIQAGQGSTRWLITAADHSTFGKNVSNEFRYGRQWAPVFFARSGPPDTQFFTNFATGIGGNGFVTGTGIDNAFLNQGREVIVNSIQDNLSLIKGSHTLRFGGDLENLYAISNNDAGIVQSVTLSGAASSNPTGLVTSQFPGSNTTIFNRATNLYADVMGILGSFSQTYNVTSPTSGFVNGATRLRLFQEKDLALYGEDQWKFRPNLTLSYGVRWEFLGVPTVPNGLAIQVTNVNDLFGVSGFGNLFQPNAPAGAAPPKATLDFVSGNTGKPIYKNQWKNFAPFFGFAWSPDFKSGFLHRLFGSQGTSSFRGGYSWSYLHDGFTVLSNALGTGTTNPGLIQTSALTTPTGALVGAIPLPAPTFTIPITDRANNLINPNNGLWAIDPNLRAPYVQQWSFGFEREVAKNTALEVRYVGNHAIRVFRAVDYNEVNIFENGFLQEFLNAQKNLTLNGGGTFADPAHGGVAGTVALPILTKFFTGFSNTSGSAWTSSGFISNLVNNNVASMASTLAFSNTYRTNRETAAVGIPANFFVANPNAAFIRLLGNNSMSNYHSLQVEFRRRFSNGLQFQADYTFAKALTDAGGALGNNQSDLVNFRTLRNTSLDRLRSPQDQTHRFIANAVYELPFGSGKRFLNAHGAMNQVLGGWSLGGIVTWQTRPPWYVVSNRNTFNNFSPGNNPAQLVGISFEEFQKNLGLFRTPAGVFFVNPAILDIKTDASGKFVSSQLKAGLMAAPAPGTFGNFPLNSLSGPRYFNLDLSLVKRWRITERFGLELKSSAINVLNRPTFVFGNQTFDSTNFGQITSTSNGARIVNFQITGKF